MKTLRSLIIGILLLANLYFCCADSNQISSAVGKSHVIREKYEIEHITKESIKKFQPTLKGEPGFKISSSPKYVGSDVPRLFFIEVTCKKTDLIINVEHDEKLTLICSPPKSLKKTVRWFYFRTNIHSEGKTSLMFTSKLGSITVPLVIWNYEKMNEYRMVNNSALPRRYPLHGRFSFQKTHSLSPKPKFSGRTKTLPHYSGRQGKSGYQAMDIAKIDSDLIWDKLVPDSSMPRYVHNPLEECPFDGKEIFKISSYYPWLLFSPLTPEGDNVWSPISCKKLLTNDFSNGDMYSGARADDGFHGYELNGKRIRLRAYLNYHQAQDSHKFPVYAASNYLSTGNPEYLHKALVSFCRIALEYSYLAAMPQYRRTGKDQMPGHLINAAKLRGKNVGFLGMGIATAGAIQRLSAVYQDIFHFIENDQKIVNFLKKKGLPIRNHDDVKRFIEENFFLTGIQAILDGTVKTNYPGTDLTLMKAIKALNYPSSELVDLVYNGSKYFTTAGVENILRLGYFRDGIKRESMSGYNRRSLAKSLDYIETLRDILAGYPELFPSNKYYVPSSDHQLVAALRSHMKTMTTDTLKPQFGDGGKIAEYSGPHSNKKIVQPSLTGDETIDSFYRVYLPSKNKDLAWVIANSPWNMKGGSEYPYTHEYFKNITKSYTPEWLSSRKSDVLPGYGVSILRGGEGKNRRALYTRFSKSKSGHEQQDMMSLCLDGFESPIMRSWGYPRRWDDFYRSWVLNNTGRPFPKYPPNIPKEATQETCYRIGKSNLIADSGNIHASDISSQLVYDPTRKNPDWDNAPKKRYTNLPVTQRRINMLIDIDENRFYCLDLYRMFGGQEQWRSINTLEGDLTYEGLTTVKQKNGTLAGANIPYADKKWINEGIASPWKGMRRTKGGFSHFYNVKKGRPNGPWSATWHVENSRGLKIRRSVIHDDHSEVIFCTTKEPTGSLDLEKNFIFSLHKSEFGQYDARSQVLSLYDGWRKNPVIKEARAINVTGTDQDGYVPLACEVILEGRRDYIILSADNSSEKRIQIPNGKVLKLNGRIGFLSLDSRGNILKMHLFNGKSLTYGKISVSDHGIQFYKIAAVDYKNWKITLDGAIDDPQNLKWSYFNIMRGGINITLQVVEAKNINGRTEIKVNYSPLLYSGTVYKTKEGRILGVKNTKNMKYTTFSKMSREARIVSGHTGKSYITETGRVVQVQISQERSPEATEFNMKENFPVGSKYYIYDYGVGDRVQFSSAKGKSF